MSVLAAALRTLDHIEPIRFEGRVVSLRGLTVVVRDLPTPIGSLVEVSRGSSGVIGRGRSVVGEVVGFDGPNTIVMMLSTSSGIAPGDRVIGLHASATVPVSEHMLGRCVNGLCVPVDGLGTIHDTEPVLLDRDPAEAMDRPPIDHPMKTGIRAIDLMTPLGRGQRIGLFAGPGVGKSTLLGQIARRALSDVNVISMIGERGREVREFIERSLGPEGLARSVVVVSTSDEPAPMRVRAAMASCAIAEYFRDRGAHVLLMMDSLTRFAHAQRQIGLSIGEPPATRGYTPSVFSSMSRLLERAGTCGPSEQGFSAGSITGLYAVLIEGDDMTEPVADASRGVLDGHVVLSRKLAQRAHYPAIDVLDSVSRVADEVSDATHAAARRQALRFLAAYERVAELVQIGAYAPGSDPEADVAIRYHESLVDLLQQESDDHEPHESSRSRLIKIAMEMGSVYEQVRKARAAALNTAV